jgi:hypothetical protein
MVSILASSVVDREFEPQSRETKDYEIGKNFMLVKITVLYEHMQSLRNELSCILIVLAH